MSESGGPATAGGTGAAAAVEPAAEPENTPAVARLRIGFRLNGKDVTTEARSDETLVDVLRLGFGLGGARESCGLGVCGTCTALVDGRPVSGCLYPAALLDGCDVLTVEGLGRPTALHPIQEAFLAENAFQCGYCTPGFVLMTYALLRDEPDPDDEQVRAYLSGNLCRCGSHETLLRAVRRAARALRAGPAGG